MREAIAKIPNFIKMIACDLIVLAIGLMIFTGCNYDMVDMVYTYDYAYIFKPDGSIFLEGKVDKWTDYEGEQLQVTIDGKTYLVSSYDCILVKN